MPDKMTSPPWPKGKKLVHLDLKGAPPRVEYLHKVMGPQASVISCSSDTHLFLSGVFVWGYCVVELSADESGGLCNFI